MNVRKEMLERKTDSEQLVEIIQGLEYIERFSVFVKTHPQYHEELSFMCDLKTAINEVVENIKGCQSYHMLNKLDDLLVPVGKKN